MEQGQDLEGLKTKASCPASVPYNFKFSFDTKEVYPRTVDGKTHINAGCCSSVPLVVAVGAGNNSVVEYLLKCGASVNASVGPHSCTPLHAAIASRRPDTALLLLDAKPPPNVNAKDEHGNSPLHLIAIIGEDNPETVCLSSKRLKDCCACLIAFFFVVVGCTHKAVD